MIIGIGTDLVEIARIEKAITRFGAQFLNRVFTANEQEAAALRGDQPRFYAMRFAAKEAAWKALSPGRGQGVGWHDLEITASKDGKPELHFHGKAKEVFGKMVDGGGKTNLSLSDDGGMALAFVVLSAP